MACLAMISGRDYAVVRADMPPAQIEHGLADNTVLWWLNRQAIWSRRSWTDGEGARPIPRVGTAICLTRDAHWIVLTDGMVLDPARETPLAHYEITQVIEVFPLASLPEDRRDRDDT